MQKYLPISWIGLFSFFYKVPLGASEEGIKTSSQQCGKSNRIIIKQEKIDSQNN